MTRQALTGKIEFGYGFDSPRKRNAYNRPSDKLRDAFEEWLGEIPDEDLELCWEKFYDSAAEKLSTVPSIKEISPEELHAIISEYDDHPRISQSGLFLTAAYNSMPIQDILVDVDTKLNLIGNNLKKGKRIVLKNDVFNVGDRSEGEIIVCGSAVYVGWQSKGGIIVNYGGIVSYGWMSGAILINAGHVEGDMGMGAKAPLFNYGTVLNKIGQGCKELAINSGNGLNCDGLRVLNTVENCLQYPRLLEFGNEFARQLEKHRNLDFPECLGILDFVRKEVGTKKEFEKKAEEMMK